MVFEEVGQVATSLSYLHVAIPLNITGLQQLVESYHRALGLDGLDFPMLAEAHNFYDNHFDGRLQNSVIKPALKDLRAFLAELHHRAARYSDLLRNLTELMPSVVTASPDAYNSDMVHFRRRKRFVPFSHH